METSKKKPEQWEVEFKRTLSYITKTLSRAEKILRLNNLSTPINNYSLKPNEKIRIPNGYIRTADYFRKRYGLFYIIKDRKIINNIAYALQTTDFFNYLINRFDIGLSVGKIIMKLAIINAFSATEGILYGAIKTLNLNCKNQFGYCTKNSKCNYYIKTQYSFTQILDVLEEKSIISFSTKEKEVLIYLKGLRDNVHIWDTDISDLENKGYDLSSYNASVRLLHKLRLDLLKGVVDFRLRRKNDCNNSVLLENSVEQ